MLLVTRLGPRGIARRAAAVEVEGHVVVRPTVAVVAHAAAVAQQTAVLAQERLGPGETVAARLGSRRCTAAAAARAVGHAVVLLQERGGSRRALENASEALALSANMLSSFGICTRGCGLSLVSGGDFAIEMLLFLCYNRSKESHADAFFRRSVELFRLKIDV